MLDIDDVADYKRIINDLSEENSRLKGVIDSMPGSVYWKDKNGVYLGRNKYSFQKSIEEGVSSDLNRDSILGKTDYDYLDKDVADQYRKNDLKVLLGQDISVEEEVNSPKGKLVQLSQKCPLRDERGEIVGIIGNTIDITYLKKIELELKVAKEEAEKANRLKTEFIHNMEHDICTPFSGILGIIKALLDREMDDEKKNMLSLVYAGADELLDYCNILLDFSKIESYQSLVSERKICLRENLNKLEIIMKPIAQLKGLSLEFEIQEDVPDILLGDEFRLIRILLNLVSNAIKFTSKGYVKVSVEMLGKIRKQEVLLQFKIEETGIGISEDKKDFIYKKFYRGTVF